MNLLPAASPATEAAGTRRAGGSPVFCADPSTGSRRTRILVLSADVGEGHAAAARALVSELQQREAPADVVVEDGLCALGRILRTVVRDAALFQFEHLPRLFGFVHWLIMRTPARRLAHAVLYLMGASQLLRLIERHRPDVIVSTFSGVNPVLGRLRQRGRLDARVCTTVLDPASLGFWVHPGLDLHLVMHPESEPLVERLAGPAAVRAVRPLVAPVFYETHCQMAARQALGLPVDGRVVLVTGGGCGIGDLEGAIDCALRADATVVCVTGRNEEARGRLENTFAGSGRVRILGFVERMRELIAAADVVVHSGGGMTSLETLVADRPSIVYRPPPGHWRTNATAMCALGIAEMADTPSEFGDALARVLADERGASRPWPATATSDAVLAADASARRS